MIKKSFFEKLTGVVDNEDDDNYENKSNTEKKYPPKSKTTTADKEKNDWEDETVETAELSVDVYEKGDKIIIKTMVAGVKPEDLDISITRDMITISGTRKESETVIEDGYFQKELYWGAFSRMISLPEEIEVEEAEATEENGLLTIVLPKINKSKKAKLKIKSI